MREFQIIKSEEIIPQNVLSSGDDSAFNHLLSENGQREGSECLLCIVGQQFIHSLPGDEGRRAYALFDQEEDINRR